MDTLLLPLSSGCAIRLIYLACFIFVEMWLECIVVQGQHDIFWFLQKYGMLQKIKETSF